RLDLVLSAKSFFDALDLSLEIALVLGVALDRGPACAFDQHLHGAVGQLQQLKHRGERAHGINAIGRGLVIARVLLRDKQDLLVRAHHFFKRGDRLLASHEQRHDHVREYDNVAQRQDPIALRSAFCGGGRLWFGHCSSVAFFPGGTVEALRRSIFRPPLRTASSPTNAVRCRGGSVACYPASYRRWQPRSLPSSVTFNRVPADFLPF